VNIQIALKLEKKLSRLLPKTGDKEHREANSIGGGYFDWAKKCFFAGRFRDRGYFDFFDRCMNRRRGFRKNSI